MAKHRISITRDQAIFLWNELPHADSCSPEDQARLAAIETELRRAFHNIETATNPEWEED